jgi:hypothetical protein
MAAVVQCPKHLHKHIELLQLNPPIPTLFIMITSFPSTKNMAQEKINFQFSLTNPDRKHFNACAIILQRFMFLFSISTDLWISQTLSEKMIIFRSCLLAFSLSKEKQTIKKFVYPTQTAINIVVAATKDLKWKFF